MKYATSDPTRVQPRPEPSDFSQNPTGNMPTSYRLDFFIILTMFKRTRSFSGQRQLPNGKAAREEGAHRRDVLSRRVARDAVPAVAGARVAVAPLRPVSISQVIPVVVVAEVVSARAVFLAVIV